jgi:hypothetical protein
MEGRIGRALDHPGAGVVFRTALLMVLAFGIEEFLMRITHLREEAFAQPVLAVALAERLAGAGIPGLLVLCGLAGLVAIAAWKRSLGPRWTDLEHGARLRLLIVAQAGVLAWMYASYDYNFYLDRSHAVDRLLLIAAVPLIAWRPVVTPVFLAALLPVIWQFTVPIGGFSWAVPILPLRGLFLFCALGVLRTVTTRIRTTDFLFVLLCMIAANYWASGVAKLRLDWIAIDRIGFLLPSTYANGWLGFLSPERIATLTGSLLSLNVPAKIVTLLIECGALLVLWRHATVRVVLLGGILLHLFIFAATGIGFWQWSLLNALVVLLFFGRIGTDLPLFTMPRFALSLVLIGFSGLWFRPVRLAWLDARATYTYRLEATGAGGATYALPPAFFAPYDYQFTLSAFRYLVDDKRLPITWGATNPDVARELNAARTAHDVLALEGRTGRNDYDAERGEDFDGFVRDFVTTWERRGGRSRLFALLQAPATLWTFPRSEPVLKGDRIARVTVYEVLSFFDDERYEEIRITPVRIIETSASPDQAR